MERAVWASARFDTCTGTCEPDEDLEAEKDTNCLGSDEGLNPRESEGNSNSAAAAAAWVLAIVIVVEDETAKEMTGKRAKIIK